MHYIFQLPSMIFPLSENMIIILHVVNIPMIIDLGHNLSDRLEQIVKKTVSNKKKKTDG